jgi:tripartite-type tricarboxylate transporter receptor subunit TctC
MKPILFAALAALLAGPLPARSQAAFPTRTVKIIVPVVPGSFTDLAGRALAAELAGPLGHPVVVENRPGAGTTLGTTAVAQSDPDGHTLLITENSFTISPALYSKLPYDPINDFAPVTPVAEAPYILWSRNTLEARTIRELIASAKAKPGTLTFASGGQGTSSHLSAELFFEKTGIQVVHIPFKGVGASMTDVIAGRVDFGGSSIASPIGHIRAGKLRPLAVTGSERSPMLPDVPTFAEAGVPGYDASIWFGVLAPARTPPAAIARIHQELRAAIGKPAIQELFQKQGAKPLTLPSAEFAKRLAAETHTWKDLVQRRGIKVE